MDNKLHAACIGILIVCIVLMIMNTLKDEADLHLVQDSLGCEALVIQGSVSNVPMLFMVDTAYAGAPVLSTSYLAVTSAVSIMPDKQMSAAHLAPAPSSAAQAALQTMWRASHQAAVAPGPEQWRL